MSFQTFSNRVDNLAVEMMRLGLPLSAMNLNYLSQDEQDRIKEVFANEAHVRKLYVSAA